MTLCSQSILSSCYIKQLRSFCLLPTQIGWLDQSEMTTLTSFLFLYFILFLSYFFLIQLSVTDRKPIIRIGDCVMQTKAFLEQLNSIAKTKKKQNLEHKNALLNVINLPDWRWFGAIFIRSTHTHTFDSWNNLITYGISQFSIRKKISKKTRPKQNQISGSVHFRRKQTNYFL